MILANSTWKDVAALDRKCVVLLPTGSLEQHGPHLPLFTDSLLATAVGEAVERVLGDSVLLTPTLWLGASTHHLSFPGTLSASFETYGAAIADAVESLVPHGFTKFYLLNAHGGNSEPNGIAMRRLKAKHPALTFGHSGYYAFIAEQARNLLEGPTKEMRHACEAETSLMLYLHSEMVREDAMRNDGLSVHPPLRGIVHHFDEVSEEGSLGHAKFAKATTGKQLFEAAVDAVAQEIKAIAEGYVLKG